MSKVSDDEFYKTLLESTLAIPWRINWKTKEFTYIGPQIEGLLGWSVSSWKTAQDWIDRIHPDDREHTVSYCVRLSDEGVDHEADYRALKSDGSIVWIRDVVHVLRGGDSTSELIGFMFDISERKKLENELVELTTSLEKKVEEEVEKNRQQQFVLMHQSRYAQMGEMFSMIAHQWRQPLNNLSIIIQGAFLKYKVGRFNDELMLKLSHDSKNQIMQMSQTIDDFRDFFKPNRDPKVFIVNASILHAMTLLKPIFEQELIIVETQLEDNVSIKGFSNELEQALINILNNAKDALIENNSNKKKIISIVLKKEKDNVVISVEDNAGGIADNIIDNVFEPYFSTKKEKDGTGLGLYMSKNIIEEHCHGRLSVENSSRGAIFKIVLKEESLSIIY